MESAINLNTSVSQKDNLKITYFVYWHNEKFKYRSGGPQKVYELCDNLKSQGHHVILFIPKIGYPETQTSAEVESIPFIDLPIIRFFTFQAIAFLKALWKILLVKRKPDVILVRIMWSFLPMILGKVFSIPVVLEVNDNPYRAYSSINNALKRKIVHRIDRMTYRQSDFILPATKKIAHDLSRIDNVPLSSMSVLPSGSNSHFFRPLDKSLCCRKLSFDPSLIYIGFLGSFFYYQGIDILIDSAPLIVKNNPDVFFLLVGDGPERPALEGMASKMNIYNHFIFTGHVPYAQAPWFCNVMDICVAPLRREAGESSAVKIYDYFACGKPVILSDIENSGKNFGNSMAAVLVNPEDPADLARAAVHLLSDPVKRQMMGKNGRSYILSGFDRKMLAERMVHDVLVEKLGIPLF